MSILKIPTLSRYIFPNLYHFLGCFLIPLIWLLDSALYFLSLESSSILCFFLHLAHHSFSFLVQWQLSFHHLDFLLMCSIVPQKFYNSIKLDGLQKEGPNRPLPQYLTCLESTYCCFVVVVFK